MQQARGSWLSRQIKHAGQWRRSPPVASDSWGQKNRAIEPSQGALFGHTGVRIPSAVDAGKTGPVLSSFFARLGSSATLRLLALWVS